MNPIIIIVLSILLLGFFNGFIWQGILSNFHRKISSAGYINPCGDDNKYMYVAKTCIEVCGTGSYLNPIDYKCYPCPMGTEYDPGTCLGVNACRHCPTGFYSDQVGSLACIPCPDGMISTDGITCHTY